MVDRFIDDIIKSVKDQEESSNNSLIISQGNQGEQVMDLRNSDLEKEEEDDNLIVANRRMDSKRDKYVVT